MKKNNKNKYLLERRLPIYTEHIGGLQLATQLGYSLGLRVTGTNPLGEGGPNNTATRRATQRRQQFKVHDEVQILYSFLFIEVNGLDWIGLDWD